MKQTQSMNCQEYAFANLLNHLIGKVLQTIYLLGIDPLWTLGITPKNRDWVIAYLRRSLSEWEIGEDYSRKYIAVKITLIHAFLEGPIGVTYSPLLWVNCLKELGIEPTKLKKYLKIVTREDRFLQRIIQLSALKSPDS